MSHGYPPDPWSQWLIRMCPGQFKEEDGHGVTALMTSVNRTRVEADGSTTEAGPPNQLASATAAVLWPGISVTMLKRAGSGNGALHRSLTLLENLVKMRPLASNLTILRDEPLVENEWKCISRWAEQNFVGLNGSIGCSGKGGQCV
jgi:hypothetical protein